MRLRGQRAEGGGGGSKVVAAAVAGGWKSGGGGVPWFQSGCWAVGGWAEGVGAKQTVGRKGRRGPLAPFKRMSGKADEGTPAGRCGDLA